MPDIKELLKNEAAAQVALVSSIVTQSQNQIWLSNLLKAKKTEQQAFEEIMDVIEDDAEEKHSKLAKILQQNIQAAIGANISLKDVEIGLTRAAEAGEKARVAMEADDLGADIIPLPIDAFPEDSAAIVPDYGTELVPIEEDNAESLAAEQSAKENLGTQESFALNIILNEDQLAAKEMAFAGKSFALIGAAGTGKTLTQRTIAASLLEDDRLATSTFKKYNSLGERSYVPAPSIAFVAFTRRAAANLAKAIFKDPVLAEELRDNVMTIHSLLEFEPETYFDALEAKEKFRFAPKRTADNPLTITHLVIEESSMLDAMTLWGHLYAALPAGVQIIFIGDINQLPPVFGPSILNYALVQLPIIELKKVYRNQGIVLENAHRILKGESLLENNNFEIVRGKQPVQLGQEKLSHMLGNLFNQWLDLTGDDGLPVYDPEDCMILSPWNKQALGTDNINAWIAQHLGVRRGAIVHEIIAGFSKVYLAKGDRVMFNKLDGIIEDIYRNPDYHGKEPQVAGSDLSRFGVRTLGHSGQDNVDDLGLDYSNFSLEALEQDKADRKMQASHVVRVLLDNGKVEEITGAGDFGPAKFSLGYALTVHKAQGSEWRKVFLILHKDHAISLYRELFYTAVTRARTKVTIVSKDFVIEKAIKNQRIKGDTIKDKIEYFNSGIMDNMKEPIYATKS